ncbi:SDR family NAD(P)-dependent oxidoreductase [Flexithrix dorotheae]|uniref:SDR family NAD(P)-dependent oxidoreductase n=1 Tax=Flexithrix dorotheae TaxID=70993 RepID=UPI000369132D|nr:SDR family oxidoreductase [Flexithrix dorotheae]
MKKAALITGASSGIGLELAKIHASKGDNLVLVARREEKLLEIKAELEKTNRVEVTVIAKDLSKRTAPEEIYKALEKEGIVVEYLINNAGFGGHGKFHERDWGKDEAMIEVNIMALTALTRLFLPGMAARKSGKVLNVASTAGFIPGPLQAVYYATKAYVVSFSQAIAEELRGTNVTVTALCPGATETEFAKSASLDGVEIFDQKLTSAYDVAMAGYNAMKKGKLVEINEGNLKFMLNWVIPFLPRKTVLRFSRKSMEKK